MPGGGGLVTSNPKSRIRNPRSFVFAFLLISGVTAALDFPLLTPPQSMFRADRETFRLEGPPDGIAILRSAPTRVFSNDTDYPYRQDSDFYYLTGLEEPDAVALLKG